MKEQTDKKESKNASWTFKSYMKFLIPSIVGVLLFMLPITMNQEVTIPIAILSTTIQKITEPFIEDIIFIIIAVSFLGACFYYILNKIQSKSKNKKIERILNNEIVKTLFSTTPLWFVIRAFSFLFVVQIYTKKGIGAVISADTGTFVFIDLLPVLFSVFLLAGLFLPLLLNFGLLEFAGTLLTKVMKPVFGLPGRSAIDAIASWLGDGTIGVLLTSKQYEERFYTEKEAAVIGTSFSLVSITFCIVVINTVGLGNMFVPFYLTVTFACIIAAIVVPKIPPLSRKKNLCMDGSLPEEEAIPNDMTGFRYGVNQALIKAKDQKILRTIFKDGSINVLDMWIGVIPIVLTIGTVALILAEYSPFFKILGLPFLPILQVLQIPEAVEASQTIFAGFADMLLPSVMIANVESDLTRFVVAAVSVSQLIYLSEVGALLIASKIPVRLKDLILIFIERTLVTLPIIALIAHMLF